LDDFAHRFYGYGNYGGPFWFVGMEEGGGDSSEEIARRLSAWAARGRCELEDAAEATMAGLSGIPFDVLPFPAQGNQRRFVEELVRLLTTIRQ
jgi:hypothetical protein